MPRGGEHFHVNAYLCQKLFYRSLLHAGHFAKLLDTSLQRLHPAVYLLVESIYLFLDVLDTLSDCPYHELVVLCKVPLYGQGNVLLCVL